MPLPDPHDEEITVEVDPELVSAWRRAQNFADEWAAIASAHKQELISQIGDATAGTVGGDKVFSYRPENRYAVARLQKEQWSLAQHFMTTKTVETLDVDAFGQHHPEIVSKYQVRSFRGIE